MSQGQGDTLCLGFVSPQMKENNNEMMRGLVVVCDVLDQEINELSIIDELQITHHHFSLFHLFISKRLALFEN